MSGLHLHIPDTAEIAEAHAHSVVVAAELFGDLFEAVGAALGGLEDMHRRFNPDWDGEATPRSTIGFARATLARAAQLAPIACPTCATTRAALRALLAANTDHATTDPDWHAAIAGARDALAEGV